MSTLFHVPDLVPVLDAKGRLSTVWKQLVSNMTSLLNQGVPAPLNTNSNTVQVPQSITLPLAKITGGGVNGSITITNGIVTAFKAAT